MNTARWRQIKEIFGEACDTPTSQRDALLDARCAADPDLRREVEALLGRDLDDDFICPPDADVLDDAARHDRATARIGERVGAFRLESVLGGGGMGDVYRAVRVEGDFEQTVAIKLLRGDMFSPSLSRRLQAERQTLARLSHPYIARLIDGGRLLEGQPYLALEFVNGVPIHAYCDDRAVDLRSKLQLFTKVCEAVEYAHRNLVLHCDLKPGNILVQTDGTPKLLDFGIARLLAPRAPGAATTQARQFLTPEFASPEQIRGEAVSTTSDIYALGVVLFRILTGTAPFRLSSKSRYDLERTINETDAPRPSAALLRAAEENRSVTAADRALCRQLTGDLDTLVLKCLRKSPEQRYSSVEQLRLDVLRFLNREPIHARPPSLRYIAGKFVSRHPLGVGASLLAFVAVVAGAATTAWQASVARTERDAARTSLATAETQTRKTERLNALLQSMLAASDPAQARGSDLSVHQLLVQASARAAAELAGEPEIEASLRSTIGASFLGLGRYAEAEAEFARALALRERLFGRKHEETLSSLNDLGVALQNLERYDEAERCYREALDNGDARLGPQTEESATRLSNLATLLHRRKRFAEAESLCRLALAIRERTHGRESAPYAESLNNLASLLLPQRKLEEAEAATANVLAIRRRVLGENHPLTAQSYVNLSALLFQLNRTSEAVSIGRDGLERHLELLGPDHPTVATVQLMLGTSLYNRGSSAEAELLLRDALRIRELVFASESAAVLKAKHTLGMCLADQGCHEEAARLLASVIANSRENALNAPLAESAGPVLRKLYEKLGTPERAGQLDADE